MAAQNEQVRRISAAQYALQTQASREQIIRRIQTGDVKGGLERGRWFVYEPMSRPSRRRPAPSGAER